MQSAFDDPQGRADFHGMAPRRPKNYLALSEVFHQTFLELDEEGTKPVAATAVVADTVTALPTENASDTTRASSNQATHHNTSEAQNPACSVRVMISSCSS
jgi:serine protease inhibitor